MKMSWQFGQALDGNIAVMGEIDVALHREFTIEHGEVTATMKVRRKQVMENFKADVDALYQLSASGRGGE